ncbi:MAG: helix-turn-helix domain-containing protein [Bacteroidales bacterium]|nr:helix-turn-helix domain-containing protein [Bacteroidales bacterium]
MASLLFVCHFPFLFVYAKSLAIRDYSLMPKKVVHLLPFLLMAISVLPLLLLNPSEQSQVPYSSGEYMPLVALPMLVLVITSAAYLWATHQTIRKHRRAIRETFSFEEKITLTWIQAIVYGFTGLFLLILIVFTMLSIRRLNVAITDYILFAGLVTIIIFIGFRGYKQGRVYTSERSDKNQNIIDVQDFEDKSVARTDIPDADELLNSLQSLMKTDKPYLDPELTIYTLAKLLDIPSHQLSRLLNNHLNQSFFEFVNRYRVDEFRSLLLMPRYRHYSILAIALEAGFNSKASFNRIFKNITKLTPTEYKKRVAS